MATTEDRGEDLTELGRKLLDESSESFSLMGGIRHGIYRGFAIQCSIEIDGFIYETLEEATLRWLQLRVEGKI